MLVTSARHAGHSPNRQVRNVKRLDLRLRGVVVDNSLSTIQTTKAPWFCRVHVNALYVRKEGGTVRVRRSRGELRVVSNVEER